MTTEWKDITDEMMMRGGQATQREELERQIMSSLVPKNEREHWAAMEIESLREQLAHRDAEVVSLTNQRDYEYVRAENAEQERDQLRDLLRPFAALLQEHNRKGPDDQQIFQINDAAITLGNLRRALAATEPKE